MQNAIIDMAKKRVISIKDYRDILNTLELDNICLINSSFKLDKDKLSNNVKLVIKESAKSELKDTFLIIRYKSTLKGINEDTQEVGVNVETIHELQYSSTGEKEITQEFIEKFSSYSASMLVWPYFREFVQSQISKTLLPPLILPLKRQR